jgi:hypothetical protein
MYGSAMRCKWIFPIHLPRLEGPATGQDAPGDAGEFVGKCYRQHVVMQPLPGASIQGLSPWRSQIFGLISTTHADFLPQHQVIRASA